MIDIKFSVGGKSVSPSELKDAIESDLLSAIAEQIKQEIGDIRDPQTGATPKVLVSGTNLANLTFTVQGPEKLVALVTQRLGATETRGVEEVNIPTKQPHVFLSYAFEDASVAEKIATTLRQNGIETWWAQWEMSAGDSLRQKIDEGLTNCTHFVVLLTPRSIERPWVKHEMDAALVRKIVDRCKFIPLRSELAVGQLPATLAALVSPEYKSEQDIHQLIADIYGASKKPALGAPPSYVSVATEVSDTGYSTAATSILRLYVTSSTNGEFGDPQYDVDEIARLTSLTEEDTEDALDELSAYLDVHRTIGPHQHVMVKSALFSEFDHHWKPWNPAEDALRLAKDLITDDDFPYPCDKICERYGWHARRLNPAITYLLDRGAILETSECGTSPYVLFGVQRNERTRRFVKERAR